MGKCSVKYNSDGKVIGGIAPNGEPSILFNSLKRAIGSTDGAFQAYAQLRGAEMKSWIGIDWEAGVTPAAPVAKLYKTSRELNTSYLGDVMRDIDLSDDIFIIKESSFKDSKVKYQVFHISKNKINQFDSKESGSNTGAPDAGLGFFFSENYETIASMRESKTDLLEGEDVLGHNIHKVSINLKNPYVHNGFISSLTDTFTSESYAKKRKELESQGYDGIVYVLATEEVDVNEIERDYGYVVFDAKNTKIEKVVNDKKSIEKHRPNDFGKKSIVTAPVTPVAPQSSAMDSFYLDKNGEPKFFKGANSYYIQNNKGEHLVFDNIKIREGSSSIDMNYETELAVTDTLASLITDRAENDPEFFRNPENVAKYFNPDRALDGTLISKGILADDILGKVFVNISEDNIELARALAYIHETKGVEEFLNSVKEYNMELHPHASIYMSIYANWADVVEPLTENIIQEGWRSRLQSRLVDFGINLIDDGTGTIENLEGEYIKIHGKSHINENPMDKLSDKAKSILGIIKNSSPNMLGISTPMTVSEVYSAIAEATVGQNTYKGMVYQLKVATKYKPQLQPIVDKLESLKPDEQATLYSTFGLVYKNFLLFKSSKITEESGNDYIEHKMYSPNHSNIAKIYKKRFEANVKQTETRPNPRALYNSIRDSKGGELLTYNEEVRTKVRKSWKTIDKYRRARINEEVTDELLDATADFLWYTGIQYGNTLEDTRAAIKKYIEIESEGVNQMGIYAKFFTDGTLDRIHKLIDTEGAVAHIGTRRQEINKLFSIAHLFEEKPFGSFITAMGKQVWPINMPTPMDEFLQKLTAENANEYLNTLSNDPLFSPGGPKRFDSILLQTLKGTKGKELFNFEIFDAFKSPFESIATSDYENQSEKTSLIVRLNAFANLGTKNSTKIAIPTQADRKNLGFATMPRTSHYLEFGVNVTRTDIIKGFIIQDLARISQARKAVVKAEASGDTSNLYEGYHYKQGSSPLAMNGSVFSMTQISGLTKLNLETGIFEAPALNGISDMADQVEEYLFELNTEEHAATNSYTKTADTVLFEEVLDKQVEIVEEKLKRYEQELKDKLESLGIQENKLSDHVYEEMSAKKDFLASFVFEDFVGRIESAKLLRGGLAFSKNTADFYKRTGLLNTPGTKMFIKGMALADNDSDYGMKPTYKEITIADFSFEDLLGAQKDVMFMYDNLKPLVGEEQAKYISDKYLNVNKTDAQGFISLHMYKNIMEGLGSWEKLDQEAYHNAFDADPTNPNSGKFVDNTGLARALMPLKPYHEELTNRNGLNVMSMNKNSYMTVTPELAVQYPQLQKMFEVMQSKGVDVINTRTATKGARRQVQDVLNSEELTDEGYLTMDSSKLRFPQIIPNTKSNKITFSKQIRKGIVSNIHMNENYLINGFEVPGNILVSDYQKMIDLNLEEDTVIINTRLGKTALEDVIKNEGLHTQEHADAKLEFLQNLRNEIKKEIKRKGLPKNYLKALNIIPAGAFNYEFEVPLAFPNYKAKYEGIILGIYNRDLFTQKLNGKDLVQIAEAGGHIESGELRFYNGTKVAQARMRASDLGFPPGTNIKDVPKELLTVLGYRTPNQGKNSSIVFEIVGFLPESSTKAIMVPGGITEQMGSDFDIDKLSIIIPEKVTIDGVIQKVSTNPFESDIVDMSRKQRDNHILDTFISVLSDPKHLVESLLPLDSPRLKNLAAELRTINNISTDVDYNNPLAEIEMESRNKAGLMLRGLWSNVLAGRNVAEGSPMTLAPGNTITIQYNGVEELFDTIGISREFQPETGEFTGPYTDYIISTYLSTAVDASKDPIQIDINDNIYTMPVASLMLSTGVPVEDVVYFLSQPIIKETIELAQNEEYGLPGFVSAIKKVYRKFRSVPKLNAFNDNDVILNSEMMREDIKTGDNSAMYLKAFHDMYLTGKKLQTIYKIITPDNLENVNEISSLQYWLEKEDMFLYGDNTRILGAEKFIHGDANLITKAYRGTFDTMNSIMEKAGFIDNRASFNVFKDNIKQSLGKYSLTAAQHKFINKNLFLHLMTRSNSPLVKSGLLSKATFQHLYLDPIDNIATKTENIKSKYSKLNKNMFVNSLRTSDHNDTFDNKYYTVTLELPLDMSPAIKDTLSDNLLRILTHPQDFVNDPANNEEVKEIQQYGKLLIANQMFTSGFSTGFGSYVDLIHPDIFSQRGVLAGDTIETPVEFFKSESNETYNSEYFANDVHEFVRNFGMAAPGGAELVKTISYRRMPKPNKLGLVSFVSNDPRVFLDNIGYINYFKVHTPKGSVIYVRKSGSVYTKLQLKGIPGKLNELGVGSIESLFTHNKGSVEAVLDPQGISYSKFSENQEETQESLDTKVSHLKEAFAKAGVEVKVQLDSTITGLGQVVGTPMGNTPIVKLNPELLRDDTAYHEFGHIYVDMLGLDNPTVKRALEELKGTPLYNQVESMYPELKGDMLNKEVLATAIGLEGAKLTRKNPNKLQVIVNKLIRAFSKMLKALGINVNVNSAAILAEEMFAGNLRTSEMVNPFNPLLQQSKDQEKIAELANTIRVKVQEEIDTAKKLEESNRPVPLARLTRLKAALTRIEKIEDFSAFVTVSAETLVVAQAEYDRIMSLPIEQRADLKNLNSLYKLKSHIDALDVIQTIKSLMVSAQSKGNVKLKNEFNSMQDKIVEVLDQASNLDSDFNDNIIPIWAESVLKFHNPRIDTKLEDIITNLEENKLKGIYRTVGLNKTEHEYKELESQRSLDKLTEQEFKEAVTNLNIEQLKNKMIPGRASLVRELTHAHKDKSAASYLLDPMIYSSEAVIQLFVKAVDEQNILKNEMTIDLKYNLISEYELFAGSGLHNNVAELNKDLLEEITINAWTDGKNKEMTVLSLVQPLNINKYIKDQKQMYIDLAIKFDKPKREDYEDDRKYTLALSHWGTSKKGMNYNLSVKDWIKTNTEPIPGWKDKKKAITDAIEVAEGIKKKALDKGRDDIVILQEEEISKLRTELRMNMVPNTNTPKNAWVRPKMKAYANPKFLKIQNDPRLKRYYDFVLSEYMKGQKMIGTKQLEKNAWDEFSYVMPSIRKADMDRAREQGIVATTEDIIQESVQSLETDDHTGKYNSLSGELDKRVPIYYTNAIPAKDVSMDIASSLYRFRDMAHNFKTKSEIVGQVMTFRDIIERRGTLDVNPAGLAYINNTASKMGIHLPIKKPGESNTFKHISEWIDMEMFGQHELQENFSFFGKSLSATKLAGALNKYTAINTLAFNVLQGGNQYILDNLSLIQEGIAGEFMNKTNLAWAAKTFWAEGAGVQDIGKFAPTSKLGKAMELFDALTEMTNQEGKRFVGGLARKGMDVSNLMFLQQGVEYQLSAKRMLGVMDNYRGKLKDKNGKVIMRNGKEANLYDVLIIDKKGKMSVDPEVVGFNKSDFIHVIRGLGRRTNQIKGSFDNSLLKRRWYGKLLMLFRGNWMVSGFRRRYGHGGVTGSSIHTDEEMGVVSQGMYVSFYNMLRESVANSAMPWSVYNTMTEMEKANVKRTSAELSSLLGAMALVAALASIDEDDETWVSNFMLYQAKRYETEIKQWTPIWGTKEAFRMLKSPTATQRPVEQTLDLLDQLFIKEIPYILGMNIDEKSIKYQRKTGKYDKGDRKIRKHFENLVPVLRGMNKTRNPEESYKWFVQFD